MNADTQRQKCKRRRRSVIGTRTHSLPTYMGSADSAGFTLHLHTGRDSRGKGRILCLCNMIRSNSLLELQLNISSKTQVFETMYEPESELISDGHRACIGEQDPEYSIQLSSQTQSKKISIRSTNFVGVVIKKGCVRL